MHRCACIWTHLTLQNCQKKNPREFRPVRRRGGVWCKRWAATSWKPAARNSFGCQQLVWGLGQLREAGAHGFSYLDVSRVSCLVENLKNHDNIFRFPTRHESRVTFCGPARNTKDTGYIWPSQLPNWIFICRDVCARSTHFNAGEAWDSHDDM